MKNSVCKLQINFYLIPFAVVIIVCVFFLLHIIVAYYVRKAISMSIAENKSTSICKKNIIMQVARSMTAFPHDFYTKLHT